MLLENLKVLFESMHGFIHWHYPSPLYASQFYLFCPRAFMHFEVIKMFGQSPSLQSTREVLFINLSIAYATYVVNGVDNFLSFLTIS